MVFNFWHSLQPHYHTLVAGFYFGTGGENQEEIERAPSALRHTRNLQNGAPMTAKHALSWRGGSEGELRLAEKAPNSGPIPKRVDAN